MAREIRSASVVPTQDKYTTPPQLSPDFASLLLEKELELEKNPSPQLVNECIELYTQAIEFYEYKKDPKYLDFQQRMRNMLQKPQILNTVSGPKRAMSFAPSTLNSQTYEGVVKAKNKELEQITKALESFQEKEEPTNTELLEVIVRFRATKEPTDWSLTPNSVSHPEKGSYSFQRVLGPGSSQEDLYNSAAKDLVKAFMQGFNSTILAYGAPGTGKTYSMIGPEEVTEFLVNQTEEIQESTMKQFGVVPRVVLDLFDQIEQRADSKTQYSIKCSYVEVYQDSINDILVTPAAQNLKVKESLDKWPCVVGLTQQYVSCPEEIVQLLSIGTINRIIASKENRARSSLAHTVFTLSLEQVLSDGTLMNSRIHLADLAGTDTLFHQSVEALSRGETPEQTKLTLVLSDLFSRNSKAKFVCTESTKHLKKSTQTLDFADTAKLVNLTPKCNLKKSYEELESIVKGIKNETSKICKVLQEDPEANNLFELEELKAKYRQLKSSSETQIEELQQELQRLTLNSQNIDYLSYHEEINSYQDRIDECKEETLKLTQEKEQQKQMYEHITHQLESQNQTLESDNQQLQSSLEHAHSRLEKVSSELKFCKDKVFELENSLEKATQEKQKHSAKVTDLEDKLQTQQTEHSEVLQELQTLKDTLQTTLKLNSELESVKDSLQEKTYQLPELEQKAATLAKVTQEKDQLEKDYNYLATAKEDLEEALTTKLKTLQTDYQSLLQQKKEAESSLQSEKDQVESMKLLIENLSSEDTLSQVQQNYTQQLEHQKQLHSQRVEELEQELESARQELESNTKNMHETQKSLKVTAEEKQKLEQENTQLRNSNELRKQQLQDLKHSNESLKSKVEELRKEKQEDCTATELKNQELRNSLNAKLEEIQSLKSSLDHLKETHSQELTKMKEKLHSMESNKEDSELNSSNIIRSLEEQNQALKTSVVKLEKDFVTERNKSKELSAKVSQFEVLINNLKADVKQKQREKEIERKNSMLMASQTRKNSTLKFPSVQLRKTSSQYLKTAIEEAKRTASLAPEGNFQVHYGFEDIKQIYSEDK